jgi:hypothetical protein
VSAIRDIIRQPITQRSKDARAALGNRAEEPGIEGSRS